MTQLSLPYNGDGSPGFKSPGTSQEAAAAMKPTAATLRAECMSYVRRWKDAGTTTDECAEYLNQSVLSIRPRFSEMKEMGLIEDAGTRRKNRSGRNATVWRVKA